MNMGEPFREVLLLESDIMQRCIAERLYISESVVKSFIEPIYTCQRKPTSERLKLTIIVHDDRCFTNDSNRHRFQSTVKLNVEYQRIK